MNARLVFALALAFVLAAVPAAAYHGAVAPYGGYGNEYTRSSSAESVTSHESEYHRSYDDYCGWRYCNSRGSYDYGRSRDFSFSRTSDYESSRSTGNYGYAPSGYDDRGYSTYSYPYYDVGTSYGEDYRPFSEYYHMSFTSPYYDPYRYSRVGAYASRYMPYWY